jgi:hypothetical protein
LLGCICTISIIGDGSVTAPLAALGTAAGGELDFFAYFYRS